MEKGGGGQRVARIALRRSDAISAAGDYVVGSVGVRTGGAALPAPLSRTRQMAFLLMALMVVAPVLLYQLSGLDGMRQRPRMGADYVPAVEYVAAHHQPGEPVIVAWPPVAYLGLEDREDIIFVAGPADRARAQNFARINAEGEYVDFWTGSPTIISTGQLCLMMLTEQDFWLIIDGSRLKADWAYGGEMQEVIVGLTFHDRTGWRGGLAMVRRLAPEADRDPAAMSLCHQAMAREGLV